MGTSEAVYEKAVEEEPEPEPEEEPEPEPEVETKTVEEETVEEEKVEEKTVEEEKVEEETVEEKTADEDSESGIISVVEGGVSSVVEKIKSISSSDAKKIGFAVLGVWGVGTAVGWMME